jgi:hypothetical protein
MHKLSNAKFQSSCLPQAGKVQMKSKAQMANPPNPPLLKGGEGGLLIGFEICH